MVVETETNSKKDLADAPSTSNDMSVTICEVCRDIGHCSYRLGASAAGRSFVWESRGEKVNVQAKKGKFPNLAPTVNP